MGLRTCQRIEGSPFKSCLSSPCNPGGVVLWWVMEQAAPSCGAECWPAPGPQASGGGGVSVVRLGL